MKLNHRHNFVVLLAALALAAGFGIGCGGESSQIAPLDPPVLESLASHLSDHGQPPEEYVLSRLQQNRVVLLGEMHRIRHDVELVKALMPRLHEVGVYALASEFYCVSDQSSLDSLVVHPSFLEAEARALLSHGTGGTWAFQEYLDILRVAWATNHGRPAGRPPLRVIGTIPRIDYWKLNEGTEDERELERSKSASYDRIMAEAIENEVLRFGGKALVHCGINHAYSKYAQPRVRDGEIIGYRDNRCGNRLLTAHPDSVVTVFLHAPWFREGESPFYLPFGGAFDQAFLRHGRPVGFDIAGGPFAQLTQTLVGVTAEDQAVSAGDIVDGYIIMEQIDAYEGVRIIEDWAQDEATFERLRRQLPNRRWAASLRSPTEYLQGIASDTDLARLYHPIIEDWTRFKATQR